MVRHLEALYKLDGCLVTLSIQQLIDIIPRNFIKRNNGALLDIEVLESFFHMYGTVREVGNPTIFVVRRLQRAPTENVTKYRSFKVTKLSYNDYEYPVFDAMLWTALQKSPFGVRVLATVTYSDIQGNAVYLSHVDDLEREGHILLITGCERKMMTGKCIGTRRTVTGYFKVNQGYVQIARLENFITEFLRLRLGMTLR